MESGLGAVGGQNAGAAERGRESGRLESKRFLRRLAEARIEKPYMAYIFGLRVYPEVVAVAEEAGIGILDFRGERVAAVVRL